MDIGSETGQPGDVSVDNNDKGVAHRMSHVCEQLDMVIRNKKLPQ